MHDYDCSSASSIEEHARKLVGNTIEELYSDYRNLNRQNRGRLGLLVERIHFGFENNNDERPDFPEAGEDGVELKVTPIKKIRKKKNSDKAIKREGLSVKERLVIKMIDYFKVADEEWEDNSLMKKIPILLLIFYIYEKDFSADEYRFLLASLWQIPDDDIKIIKDDWEKIKDKIEKGNAHKISEGDTMYLGACTKASSSKDRTSQPYSDIDAKPRAFSLKRSYMDEVFNGLFEKRNSRQEKSLLKEEEISLEEKLNTIFQPYIGMWAHEIEDLLKLDLDHPKQYLHILAKEIMGVDSEESIEEFNKANIKIKTIRLNQNGLPIESISFPAFDYIELAESSWLESRLYERLENTKYFFVIFDKIGSSKSKKNLKLKKVLLWNMPSEDIDRARPVWEEMHKIMNEGKRGKGIIKKITKNNVRRTHFPSKSHELSEVIHVRPHGRNKEDTSPLPDTFDIREYTKHSFWFNNDYIAEQIKGANDNQ